MQTTLIAVLGLVSLFIGWVLMLIMPGLRVFAWGILALGVILLASAVIIDFRRVGRALVSRRGRFGAGTTIMVSIFIGIILLVNAISIGSYHRFDFTGVKQFSLTSQTKEVLLKLETPVQAMFFTTPDDPYGIANYTTNLLTEYQYHTEQLSVEFIDPEEHPDQARQYDITAYQTVVFESEQGYRVVPPWETIITDASGQLIAIEAEHAFTSAILEVTGIVQKKVYFLTGHGEANIYSDYSSVREGLLDNLYQVAMLDLAATPSIPEDCATLIIAGAQEALATSEVDIINDYLGNGGGALILANPSSPTGIKQLLSYWGIITGDGIIIEPTEYAAPNKDTPTVPGTRNQMGLSTTYFPGATPPMPHPQFEPVTVTDEETGMSQQIWMSEESVIQMVWLLWTSDESWLDYDFDPTKEPEFNEEVDIQGPLPLSFLIFAPPPDEAEGQGPHLIVIGDSDFASNKHFVNGDNGTLFLSSVNWLAAGEELISIDRKVVPFRRLIIGPEAETFIKFSSMGLLPLLILVIGSIIWWRRR